MASVNRSVWELQTILQTLGAPLVVDKKYGPITERTWSLLASRLGLDPVIKQQTLYVAAVDEDTHAKLLNEYILRRAPKPSGGTDFERLNNAIVLMDRTLMGSNAEVNTLATDWDRIAGDPAWRSFVMALPPVWATSLSQYWGRYLDVWRKLDTNTQVKLMHPATVEPGGVFSTNAWNDLWEPAMSEALRQGQALIERGKTLLQKVGAELGKGAADTVQKKTYEWAWSLAGLALGGLGVYLLLRRPQRPT
jgi:hypothetical protein